MEVRKKLIIITTHPIQYHVGLFSYLNYYSSYDIKVLYTLGVETNPVSESEFDIAEKWNIDLYSGYEYEFIKNSSKTPSSSRYFGIRNPSLIKIVEEYDPNALLIFGWKHHSHLRVMRYFHSKIPIIFRGDSTILDDGKYFLSNFIRYQVLKFIYRKIDLVLSPGKASDLYFKKSGLNSSQIIRAEHAVDVTRFAHLNQNEQSQLASLISGLKISHDETVFVFAGKFIKKKNPILLIEAFLHVLKQGFNVRLLLVGNGIMRDSIKKRLSALPDNKLCKINLLPFQDQNQMKLIYRLASVFVLPSSGPNETWGLSINEALASKTPVIVSDKCGCAYNLVLDGINGHVFRSDDVNDLVSKMIKFCDSKYLQTLVDNIDNTIAKYTFQSFKLALDKIM